MDLAKIDVTEIIRKYRNKIANIGLILLAVIISYKVQTNQNKAIDSLKQAKEQEEKKSTVLRDIDIQEKKINLYKELINKKDISSVINLLANIANNAGIKISSLSPAPEANFSLYTKYPFRVTASADDYNNLGRFINDLENDPVFFVIETVNIKPITNQDQEFVGDSLALELVLYTVLFK